MASGDLKYEETVNVDALTAGQRTTLTGLVSQLWGGALADLRTVVFHRKADGGIGAYLEGEQTKAPGNVPLGSRITGRVP